jgi:glyoxylase-like metal-dependent hydrolase (beta-lactamase superfamily II)
MAEDNDLPRYRVYALRYATREGRRQDNFVGGDLHDGPMPMDYFCGLAISDERRFVIDCGFTEEVAAQRKRTYLRNPVDALALLGMSAADVDDVIITHLHYDHVGDFDRFPKARFHFQETELAFATGKYMRHPFLSHAFEVEDVVGMVRLNYRGRVVFHNGDTELAPGLRLHLAGGHSAGLQFVGIHAERGWLVLASDVTHYYEHMESGRPFTTTFHVRGHPPGLQQAQGHCAEPRPHRAGARPPRDAALSAAISRTQGCSGATRRAADAAAAKR